MNSGVIVEDHMVSSTNVHPKLYCLDWENGEALREIRPRFRPLPLFARLLINMKEVEGGVI